MAGVIGPAARPADADSPAAAADTNDITADDIAAADRITGWSTSDSERALMVGTLTATRKSLVRLRASTLFIDREPATRFDPRLPDSPPLNSGSDIHLSRASRPAMPKSLDDLAFHTLTDLSRLMEARKVSSVDLTRLYLARLKKYGPGLLCVISLVDEAEALRRAALADSEITGGHYRGPLHGIPYGVKDLLAARGTRTTFGAKPFENQAWDFDSTVVARLDAAGAVLVAKLSMGELAMGDVWFGGKTRNPWKPSTGSSGSSAGPASAVAAGLVGFAIGTETLGSIVSPSRTCGVTGLRPTYGRVSRHGAMALSWTMDKIGPICRGVEDCAVIFAAIHGPDGLDTTLAENAPFRWNPRDDLRRLRVGLDVRAMDQLKAATDPTAVETRLAIDNALAVLKSLGIEPTPLQLPDWHDEYDTIADIIINVEGAASFTRLRSEGGLERLAQQADWNWPNKFRAASAIPAPDYVQALRVRTHLQTAMADSLRDLDAYITIPRYGPSVLYTNLTGHPTVLTRCGKTASGLPLSLEFTGALYREDAILRLAHAYEQATPWHKQWPTTLPKPHRPSNSAVPANAH